MRIIVVITLLKKKLLEFVETYKKSKDLDEEEEKILITFLKDCLDRKKLQRVKDVEYDKVTGDIKEIPALFYTKSNKHFTLKNMDKRVSTLKSLPPKKVKTIKNTNKVGIDQKIDSDSDNDNA